jgi:signal transduction histidine kinase
VLAGASGTQAPADSKLISVDELRGIVSRAGSAIQSFRIEGVVCAVVRGRNLLALQDSSAAVLLEVPALDQTLAAGRRVAVTVTNCLLTRTPSSIQLGTGPVVNVDGHHGTAVKSGRVFLERGWQPIRVTWFNGDGLSALQVDYEGPAIPRQKIPSSALWRRPAASTNPGDFQPGLDFAAYMGDWANSAPDYPHLTPVARGVATNFDLRHSVREEHAALAFDGHLKIPSSGIYTFYLTSSDGSYLSAGEPSTCCKVSVLENEDAPKPRDFAGAVASGLERLWIGLEGEVIFVGNNDQGFELELACQGERVQLALVESGQPLSANLLHRSVRAVGILESLPDPEQRMKARVVVPSLEQLEIQDSTEPKPVDMETGKVLTMAQQVRQLSHAESERGLPAKIRGVVTWSSPLDLILQDATGGIYIHYVADDWAAQPRVGELWEIEGTTDPGDFSPVIHAQKAIFQATAALPEPIRPNWDQLLNGSLDSEYVELRGALTQIEPDALTLLTSDGKIKIVTKDDRPAPYLPRLLEDKSSFLNSIVRIRGCLTAVWNMPARQVRAGEIFLSPGTVEVEEFAPRDPFALPARKISDLLRFDPSASSLQRTKVQGQVLFGRPGEYCVQDGTSGLRLLSTRALHLQPGDLVEVVGFPQLGGPSPILLEAQARKTGSRPLPTPVLIEAGELLNPAHDSTMVNLEAFLLNDHVDRDGRVLEMQAGRTHFIARLKTGPSGIKPLVLGSRLQLTGVYLGVAGAPAGGNLDVFELCLHSAADILVLRQPPWWNLRRALTVVAILSGVLAIALVWITLLRRKVEERTRQLEKQIEQRQLVEQRRLMEQERTRVAQDLHDELGAGLTEVGLLGDLAKNSAVPLEEQQKYLGQLTNTARSLVASLDEIVWAINPRYDSVASMVSYYTLFAQRFLNLAGLACRPQIPASFAEYPVDPKGRHGLFLAFKESLNNVVRHSGGTEVRLKIDVGGGDLIISVADNGHGFDPCGVEAGEGLQGMRSRLDRLGGSCIIKSRPGAGTEVELRFPVGARGL